MQKLMQRPSFRNSEIRLLSLLTLTIVAGCGKGKSAEPAEEKKEAVISVVEMTPAKTQPIQTTLMAQGTLSPGQGAVARVSTTVAGRLLSVNVKEGDRVNVGDLVAVVDNKVGVAQARSAAAALTVAEAQARQSEISTRALQTDQSNSVRLANLTLQSAQLDRDNAIQSAQTALQSAETDLRRTKAGARPQEIAQSEQLVAQARATRDRAQTEIERVRFLNKNGIAPLRQLNDAQTALAVANSGLEGATQSLSLIRAGARTEDLRAVELRLQGAQQTLSQAKSAGDAKVNQARAAVRQAQQSALQVSAKRQEAEAARDNANQKRADLVAAQATAQSAQLRAPMSGIVTKRTLSSGDSADVATPIIEITDPRALNLIANVPASEGAKLTTGMAAKVTSQDAPDKTFSASVLSVGQVDPLTNLLTLRLSVTNSQNALKTGQFVTAEIVLSTSPRAVVIPKKAIVSKEGKSVVFVVGEDKVAHQKEIEVGGEQDGLVEIKKGVSANENVVTLGQYELADKAKVKEAEKPKPDDEKKTGEPDEKKPINKAGDGDDKK